MGSNLKFFRGLVFYLELTRNYSFFLLQNITQKTDSNVYNFSSFNKQAHMDALIWFVLKTTIVRVTSIPAAFKIHSTLRYLLSDYYSTYFCAAKHIFLTIRSTRRVAIRKPTILSFTFPVAYIWSPD